jgi:hypothetical protein
LKARITAVGDKISGNFACFRHPRSGVSLVFLRHMAAI